CPAILPNYISIEDIRSKKIYERHTPIFNEIFARGRRPWGALKIRRSKMNKHKRVKRLRKNRVYYMNLFEKQKKTRDDNANNKVNKVTKHAENFDPSEYVLNIIRESEKAKIMYENNIFTYNNCKIVGEKYSRSKKKSILSKEELEPILNYDWPFKK
ncbi:unnamed protein product, partial [Gordionus sp. m RMFG-2023]